MNGAAEAFGVGVGGGAAGKGALVLIVCTDDERLDDAAPEGAGMASTDLSIGSRTGSGGVRSGVRGAAAETGGTSTRVPPTAADRSSDSARNTMTPTKTPISASPSSAPTYPARPCFLLLCDVTLTPLE